jgi:NAD+ kinase
MRIGLISNLKRVGGKEAIQSLVDWSGKNGHAVLICDEIEEFLPKSYTFVPRQQICKDIDLLVSMGGDGTLLATARTVGDSGVPILGINLGSLGFLTPLTPQQLLPALDRIAADNYGIQERMLLKAEIANGDSNETPMALNDMVLHNGAVARILDINLKVNGEDVVTYKADGLIISTATGSTAYNLAVGGPILNPGLEAMIAAPISPFSLTTRPMVFLPGDVLELTILSDEDREAIFTVDGQVMLTVHDGQTIRISRADHRIKFITFPEESYYELLKSKLHWGMPPHYTN